jgi:ribosome maturation factor RimP
MNGSAQIQILEQMVNTAIGADPDLFLVEIKVKPTNNIKIYIDGDQGVSIKRLVQYNRKIYKEVEERQLFPGGDFSLEVSSPGLDEPLKLYRQYVKNKGRNIEVLVNEGVKTEGTLSEISEKEITVIEQKGKGKKMETVTHTIPFENIKTTKIQIKF